MEQQNSHPIPATKKRLSEYIRELLFLLNFVEISIYDIILVSQFSSTNLANAVSSSFLNGKQ